MRILGRMRRFWRRLFVTIHTPMPRVRDALCDCLVALVDGLGVRGYPKSQEALKRHWRLELPGCCDTGRGRVSGWEGRGG